MADEARGDVERGEGKALSLGDQADRVRLAFYQEFNRDADYWTEYVEVYGDFLIAESMERYYRVDYQMAAEGITFTPREQWVEVEKDWTPIGQGGDAAAVNGAPMKASDTMVAWGDAVKALGDGRVGGYLVRFSSEADPDLTGEWFTRATYYGPRDGDGADTLVHHGFPLKAGLEELADRLLSPLRTRKDEVGIFAEAVLDMADEYEKMLYQLVEQGKLAWSSGAPGHMVRRKDSGEITRWPIAEGSLTPTPAEPRNRVITLKALAATPKSVEPMDSAAAAHTRDNQEERTMGDEVKVEKVETGGVDVQALVEGAVAKALADFQAKLEAEPAMKTPGYAVPNVHVRQEKMGEDLAFKLWMKWGNEAPPEVLKAMRRKFQRLTGLDIVDGEMKATLAEGTESQGGYWVPQVYANAIETPLANQSYLRRAGANVMSGIQGTDSFKVPSLTFSTRASIGGEGSAYVPEEPSAGEIEFNPYKLKKLALATEELVEDSRYDVWSMILQPDFEQAFAEGENYYFTNGTGSGMPQGVVYGATVGVTAASQTVPTFDEIKALAYAVDYKYREDSSCGFMMNDATALVVDKLKDGEGNYIWRESQQAGMPPRLLGFPVYFNQQMSAPATGVDAILFGAFRYYSIAPWPGLQIQRLIEKYADTGHIGFRAFRRVDGNIMQAAAFRKLRMA